MVRKKLRVLLTIGAFLAIFIPSALQAQVFRSANYWKQFRHELTFHGGTSNTLTDLGGADQIGTNGLKDLEINATRFVFGGGYRYYIAKNHAASGQVLFGMISGDDQLTSEPARNRRNLHFRSQILELSTRYEFHFINERLGHRYKLRGAKGVPGFIFGFYIFGGIGGMYFNPQALYPGRDKKDPGNEWVNLQPLGTEGQGLPGEEGKYKRVGLIIPFGVGMRYALNKIWRVGLEVGARKTFTDYLDDVSTDYYDNDVLRSERGDVAADLADRNTGESNFLPDDEPRGDPTDKDAYFFLSATISYKLTKKKRKVRRIKTRKVMPSF